MKIGYARVSTKDQNLDMQIEALKKEGCEKIYLEKQSAVKERRELEKLKETLRPGDIVIIWKLDRIGRPLRDLVALIDEFNNMGVEFKSIIDNLDTTTINGRFFFNIMASLAEYERELIRERTLAGLAAARKKGRVGGRPSGLSKEARNKAIAAKHLYIEEKKPVKEILKSLDISRATLYRYLRYMNVTIG